MEYEITYLKKVTEKLSLKKILGQNVRKIRKEKGITQNDLAKMLGMSRASINNIESGRHILTTNVLAKFCKTLEIKSSDILPF